MNNVCCVLLGYGLGIFSILFLIAWLDEREDRYSTIQWKTELDTCIDWTLRLQSLEVQPVVDIKVSLKNYRTSQYIYKKNIQRIMVYNVTREVDI